MPDFAAWAPDAYPIDTDVSAEASGVLVGPNSYQPFSQPAVSSLATAAGAAGVIRGAFAARTSDNVIKIYALSATKAYLFTTVGTAWTDVTRAAGDYALESDDYWMIRQYGNLMLATQSANDVQKADVDAGSALIALTGSPPKSKYLEVIGDFVFLGNTATSRRAVKNSGRNDAATWTVGTKDSDGQTFQDGGDVTGMAGYEVGGLVFQSETVRRLSLRTDAAIWEHHRIDAARGTLSPHSIVKDGGDVYYWANTGFMRIGADGSIANIGIDRVNAWFAGANADWNRARPKAIIGALDPIVRRIFWLYPRASNSTSTTLDGMIIYDIDRDRWTHAVVALTYIFTAFTPGLTLAALAALYPTLSAVPYPFGSDVWKGVAPGLAGFDANNKLVFFSGLPMAASVMTGISQPVSGMRGFVSGFRIIGDAQNATGSIGGAERPQTAVMFNGPSAVNGQGRAMARLSTRYAQIRVDVPAGESWTNLAGVEFDAGDISPDGKR